MAKFYGEVGYGIMQRVRPGVHLPKLVTRNYYGDTMRAPSYKWEKGEGLNDNLGLDNQISILADAFAYEHCSDIRYVMWQGTKWKVSSIELQRPRLILRIGGVYNGEETPTPSVVD